MSTVCANSSHCVAVQEIWKEMAEMNTKLNALCLNVQMLIQSSQINSSPIDTPSVEVNQTPPEVTSDTCQSPNIPHLNEVISVTSENTSEMIEKEEIEDKEIPHSGLMSEISENTSNMTHKEVQHKDNTITYEFGITDVKEEIFDGEKEFLPASFSQNTTMENEDVMNSSEFDSISQHLYEEDLITSGSASASQTEMPVKEELQDKDDITYEFGITGVKEEIFDGQEELPASFSQDSMENEDVVNSSEFDYSSQHKEFTDHLYEEEDGSIPSGSASASQTDICDRPSVYVFKKASILRGSGSTGYYCTECNLGICTEWRTHVISVHLQKPAFTCDLCDYGSKSWQLYEIRKHLTNSHRLKSFQFTDKRRQLIAEITKIGNEIIQKPTFRREESLRKRTSPKAKVSDTILTNEYASRYCKECKKTISSKWRSHIASIHLRKPALICRFCGFATMWEMHEITKHFFVEHPDQPLNITDKRSELQKEIDEMAENIIETQMTKYGIKRKVSYWKRP